MTYSIRAAAAACCYAALKKTQKWPKNKQRRGAPRLTTKAALVLPSG